MNKDQWQQIEKIFYAAMELPPGERDDFVGQACAGDEELRQEVRALLAANRDAASFLDSPVAMPPHSGTLSPTLAPPQAISNSTSVAESGLRIGAYRLIREIGRGGMGAVWLAERADGQFRQQVAIKLLHAGAENEEIIRRFRHERQILASLDHPNIARLHDGGTTEDGRPYFVMEHIEGLPIDEYCRRHQLSVDDRLRLFRQVCAAVHYAHQHLVIHRDLKPGNIVVTEDGAPKLLDFGIAKLIQPDLSRSYNTLSGVTPMTPAYASPEQVRGEKLTTASDVYSLGVVLYELLTGRSPYRLKAQSFGELMRAVIEQEPERPSTAITRADDEPSAAPITIEPPDKLRRRLAGDIDSIALMALRKEAPLRYGSVEQFSEDLRRYLEGLPTMARRGTLGYRALKYVRRNKVPVAAAALILLSLLGGIGTTLRQARIARMEQIKANTQRQRAEAALATAEERRQQSEAARREADLQKTEAEAQRNLAEVQWNLADAQRQRAESQELSKRRLLYASQMKLAQTAWDEANVENVRELLTAHIPKSGESDLRGFEWYYLWRISHSELASLPHTAHVGSVAFSPNGNSLITIEYDREHETLRLFDALTWKEKYQIFGKHMTIGRNTAFARNGQVFATGGYSCGISVWETSTGKRLKRIAGTDCDLVGLGFSPDGEKLVSGREDGKIFIFDVKSGQELFHSSAHSKSVTGLAVSPDGKTLVTTGRDDFVRLWDITSGKELFALNVVRPNSPVFSPDGLNFVLVGNGELVMVDVTTRKGTKPVNVQVNIPVAIYGLNFSPDGKMLAIGQSNRLTTLWDTKTWRTIATIKGHGQTITSVAFSPDGQRLATGCLDTVKLWNLMQSQEPASYQVTNSWVNRMTFSRDGGKLYTLDRDMVCKAIDVLTGREVFSFKLPVKDESVISTSSTAYNIFAVSEENRRIATGGDNNIKIWDAMTGVELQTIKTSGPRVNMLALSRDGSMVATAPSLSDQRSVKKSGMAVDPVIVRDTATGREIISIPQPDIGVSGIVFLTDNRTLVIGRGADRGHLTWWDLFTGKSIRSLDNFRNGVFGLASSSDGKKLAVTSADGTISLLDMITGQELMLLKANVMPRVMTFSPDGNRLLTGGNDRTVRLWDLATGQEMMDFRDVSERGGCAFSPDGRSIAIAYPRGVVKIFNAADPKSLQVAGR